MQAVLHLLMSAMSRYDVHMVLSELAGTRFSMNLDVERYDSPFAALRDSRCGHGLVLHPSFIIGWFLCSLTQTTSSRCYQQFHKALVASQHLWDEADLCLCLCPCLHMRVCARAYTAYPPVAAAKISADCKQQCAKTWQGCRKHCSDCKMKRNDVRICFRPELILLLLLYSVSSSSYEPKSW